MNDQIFEVLNNSTDEELITIVANKSNEFNNDTVNYARQILEDRKIDVSDIPVENTTAQPPRGGDEEIKTIKFKTVVHIIFGPILFLGGVVLFGMSLAFGNFSIVTLLFIFLGARSIYLYFKLRNTAKALTKNRENYQANTLTPAEFTLVQTLHDAIVLAKNGDLSKLKSFLVGNISKQNFDQVIKLYQAEYYKDFIDEIKKVSNQYTTIEQALQPLIDMNLVEPKYPHNKISQ